MALSKEELEYKQELERNQEAVRKIILDRITEIDSGKAKLKPMDEVFDRLEKKYGGV